MRGKTRSGPDPACKGCIYLGRLHASEPAPSICDYIEITGHRRGCPPGGRLHEKEIGWGRKTPEGGEVTASII